MRTAAPVSQRTPRRSYGATASLDTPGSTVKIRVGVYLRDMVFEQS